MSSIVLSPNMTLPVPVVSVDLGPDWANNLNSCLSILDQHNHASGSGVQISQAGIMLSPNATTFDSLSFAGSNAYNLRSVRFAPQGAPLALITDVGCLYFAGVDLYCNDVAGNQVRITSGGAVNATSSGISSGTATASFSGSVLVVDENTNTPANIQCGSLLIGNNVAASKFCTLSVVNSLGANYPLVLPTLPSATSYLQLDTSGNITAAIPTAINYQISASCGSSTNSSTGVFSNITNLAITITTSGRPVMLIMQPDGTGNSAEILNTASSVNYIQFYDTTSAVTAGVWSFISTAGSHPLFIGSFSALYVVAAGTYTFTVQSKPISGSLGVSNYVLVAYEL